MSKHEQNKDNNIVANVDKGKLRRLQTYTEDYRNIDSQRKIFLRGDYSNWLPNTKHPALKTHTKYNN